MSDMGCKLRGTVVSVPLQGDSCDHIICQKYIEKLMLVSFLYYFLCIIFVLLEAYFVILTSVYDTNLDSKIRLFS